MRSCVTTVGAGTSTLPTMGNDYGRLNDHCISGYEAKGDYEDYKPVAHLMVLRITNAWIAYSDKHVLLCYDSRCARAVNFLLILLCTQIHTYTRAHTGGDRKSQDIGHERLLKCCPDETLQGQS